MAACATFDAECDESLRRVPLRILPVCFVVFDEIHGRVESHTKGGRCRWTEFMSM